MEEPQQVSEPQLSTPKPPAMSLPGRLLNILAVPGDVFEQVKSSDPCAANWLAPALILIALSWVGTWLIFSQDTFKHQVTEMTDKAIEKRIEKAHMSKEQAEQVRQAAGKWAGIGSTIGPAVGAVVVAFATPFLWGLILWLVGVKALKGNFPYMKGVEVAGLAAIISALDAVVRTLLILLLGNLFASPSLALLIKEFDPQNTTHSLLALMNVMTFWVLAVRASGLARLSGATFGKAAIWVFGIWAAYTGLFVGFGVAVQRVFAG